MVSKELLEDLLPKMEYLIQASLSNKLNVHTSLGGKYGELWVASQLIKNDPRLAHERGGIKIKNAKSSDILLANNNKRLEVKWGMNHSDKDDLFVKRAAGIPLWGWGFSKGKQFLEDKFDYCVLLAAEKGGAKPQHVFILTCDEMKRTMSRRRSIVNPDSYYIEYSKNPEYYEARRWTKGINEAEKLLLDHKLHQDRWRQLRAKGLL